MPVNPKNVKKPSRPARNVNLVVSAMRNLREENGSTIGNIVGYISDYCDRPAPKREVVAALKRGLEFGIVDRRRGRYFLQTDDKTTNDKRKDDGSKADDQDSEGGIVTRRRATKKRKARKITKRKDSARGRRVRKAAIRKSKRARMSKKIKPYKLVDFHQNPRFGTSVSSSLESMDSFEDHENSDRENP